MKRTLVLILTLFLIACGQGIEPNMSRDVNDFSFTAQDGTKRSLQDLKGKWWIADFIFTNCKTVCLPMTANMAKLQDEANKQNLPVEFISFSVDPAFDTPEILKAYGETYEADFSNWSFLTGYDFETIKELSVKSFASLLDAPPQGSDQVTHGTSFFLVNPEGKVIKRYSGVEAKEMNIILEDLKKIL